MSRKPTSGNYATREELIEECLEDISRYYRGETDWSFNKIAQYHGISPATLLAIERARGDYLKRQTSRQAPARELGRSK